MSFYLYIFRVLTRLHGVIVVQSVSLCLKVNTSNIGFGYWLYKKCLGAKNTGFECASFIGINNKRKFNPWGFSDMFFAGRYGLFRQMLRDFYVCFVASHWYDVYDVNGAVRHTINSSWTAQRPRELLLITLSWSCGVTSQLRRSF